MERYPNWINSLWFSDEAHFHLNGNIYNHNIFWGVEPSDEVSEMPLKVPKSICFSALNAIWGMLGPYWFEDNVKTVTVNDKRYYDVLRRFHADLPQPVFKPTQTCMVHAGQCSTTHCR